MNIVINTRVLLFLSVIGISFLTTPIDKELENRISTVENRLLLNHLKESKTFLQETLSPSPQSKEDFELYQILLYMEKDLYDTCLEFHTPMKNRTYKLFEAIVNGKHFYTAYEEEIHAKPFFFTEQSEVIIYKYFEPIYNYYKHSFESLANHNNMIKEFFNQSAQEANAGFLEVHAMLGILCFVLEELIDEKIKDLEEKLLIQE